MHGSWSTIEIAGKPVDMYEPPERTRFGLLFLHGSDRRRPQSEAALTEALAEQRLACLCPQGQRCWWVDRVCPEFDVALTAERHLLENVLPFFQEKWQFSPPRIGLAGVEMGGQGALRLAFRYPQIFAVVGAVSAALDFHELFGWSTPLDQMYDSKEHCRQDTAILHVNPEGYPRQVFFAADPESDWFRSNDRLHEKLSALGIPHEIDFATSAGGNESAYFDQMIGRVVRFVAAGLAAESRRLL